MMGERVVISKSCKKGEENFMGKAWERTAKKANGFLR